MQPRTEADLDAAGGHLAKAVTLIGVQAVMAILLKRRPATFKGDAFPIKQFADGPRTPGRLRYRPTIKRGPTVDGEAGYTGQWGDIHITSTLSTTEQRLTLYHELIHSRLTPKLYALRDLRIAIAQNGYANSHLLRYLEEALCETYALLRGNGFSKQVLVEGIHFPIKSDYTTTALMGKEAKGLLLGSINVGGMIFQVFHRTGRPDDL